MLVLSLDAYCDDAVVDFNRNWSLAVPSRLIGVPMAIKLNFTFCKLSVLNGLFT